MEYKFRYARESTGGPGKRGRTPDPEVWVTGPCRIRHDKHYGYLKHRAQAKFRKEDYSLTLEQWESLWTDELWLQRGRSAESFCLQQIDGEDGWHFENVEIVTRIEHFAKLKQRRDLARS